MYLNNKLRQTLAKEAVRQSSLIPTKVTLTEEIRGLEQAIMKEILGAKADRPWLLILSDLNDKIDDANEMINLLPGYLRKNISQISLCTKRAEHYNFVVEGKTFKAMLGLSKEGEENAIIRPSSLSTHIYAIEKSEYAKAFLTAQRKLEGTIKAMENLEEQVFLKLKSYKTTEQMLKNWKESHRLMPALEKTNSTAVVVSDVDLNASIWG